MSLRRTAQNCKLCAPANGAANLYVFTEKDLKKYEKTQEIRCLGTFHVMEKQN